MTEPRNDGQTPPISGPRPDEAPDSSGPIPQVEGYEIAGPLGRGGMGTVWSAVQLSTRREVALKLLGKGMLGSEKGRARFEREVELTARLHHPSIAQVYDSGVHQGVYFYAMELIDGEHLDKHFEARQLTQRQILELMRTVCQAVQHAHERGVIHRDLKPSNILVTPDGQPHVLDFGLAKTFLEGDWVLSETTYGEAAGTPAYMSPEQAAGKLDQIDIRTDVYALGVMLFRLLTGKPPHDLSGSRYEVLRRIAEEEIRRPREFTKDVDRELEALLLKSLARDPKDRYPSAGALAQDIENYLTGEPLTARPPTTAYFLRKRLRKYRVPVAVGCSVVAVLIGMAVYAYIRISQERTKAVVSERTTAKALREAERENYYNSIALADRMIGELQMHDAEAVLWDSPKEIRGWEWGRLMHACREEPLILKGHSGTVTCVAISPSGKRVATASGDETAKIWDAGTGQRLFTIRGHADVVTSVSFSPDGKCLMTGSRDSTAKIWDVETCAEMLTLSGGPAMHVLATAFSPDGMRVVTGSEDDKARIWNAQTGEELVTFEGHQWDVNSAAFLPGGREVLTASNDRTAKVWDAQTGHEILSLSGHSLGVLSVAFSPDGKRVASGDKEPSARIWDTETGRELFTLRGHRSSVNSVAFSPDGMRLATGSADGTAKLWDTQTGREMLSLTGRSGSVNSVAFSPSGEYLVTGGDDNTAVIWHALDWRLSPEKPVWEARQRHVQSWYESRQAVPGDVLAYDGFDGKLALDWRILRPDRSHFSLTRRPGTLTIKTQHGTFHDHDEDYENLFLVDHPRFAEEDFQVSARISSFKPVADYNQAGLICWNDEDQWLAFYHEFNSYTPSREAIFTVAFEAAGSAKYLTFPAPDELKGVWLRITKRGSDYTFSTSLDGKTFVPCRYSYQRANAAGTPEVLFRRCLRWGNGMVSHVGLFAQNSRPTAAPEVDACFDFFEVRSVSPAAETAEEAASATQEESDVQTP